jgi:CheY-like chemotaxis protein
MISARSSFAATAATHPSSMPSVSSVRTRRLRCLVVDDERASRVMLRTTLSNWAVSCHEAEDGNVAIAWLESPGRTIPDFVLTDVEMPGCDGPTLFRRIRHSATRAVRDLPVVMMSTRALEELTPAFRGLTPLRFFSKPIDLVELRRLIEYFRAQPEVGSNSHRSQDTP